MTEVDAVTPNNPSPIALHADLAVPDDFDVSEQAVEVAPAGHRARSTSDASSIAFDEDNPEWTETDFANARPIGDFPALAKAFRNGSKPRLR